jgi:hypothetical protein
MKELTKQQAKAFEAGRLMIAYYRSLTNSSAGVETVIGDMIADLQFTATEVWQYKQANIESVRIVSFELLNSSTDES